VDPVYHVVLEGRQVGPYDRRTIVGMRIKKTLSSEHVLITTDGVRLTVADLLKPGGRSEGFQPNRSGSYSLVQATYSASLLGVQGRGVVFPRFKGEVEARVQADVLRMAGRFRKGFGWKDGRIKLPLKDIAHTRVRGSVVDLWLRNEGRTALQRVTLELFAPQSAGAFVEWFPNATQWPQQGGRAASQGGALWVAAAAASAVVVVLVAVVAFARRVH
jgi:hypothetical protein